MQVGGHYCFLEAEYEAVEEAQLVQTQILVPVHPPLVQVGTGPAESLQ